jgi:cytochrome P450
MPTTVELFGGTMMSPVPDPYPVYRRLRQEAPVLAVDGIFGRGYLVTRYDDVLAVLKDPVRYSSQANARAIGLVMGRTIIEMDGTDHRRHRNVIAPAFAPRSLRGDVPETIDRVAHHLIDQFVRCGRAELVADFTFTLPIRVFAERFFRIPVADHERFHQWALDLVSIADDPPKAFAAAQAIADYLRPILRERRAAPGDDLLSALAHAEVDGERLTEEEVVSFCRLLVPAGTETTYRLIGNTLFALLTHPEQLEAVRADRTKLEAAITETLRWEAPVQYVSRAPTAPVQLGGVEVPAGAPLTCALGSANRDERHYDDPDRFDIGRRPDDHLAFGFGKHVCAGSRLAHLEARIALDALLDRLPNLRLDPGAACGVVGLAFRSPDRLPVCFEGV